MPAGATCRYHCGFDQDADLLAAAWQRVASLGITNATLLLGNVAVPTDVAVLPDVTFDLVFSRRGPNVNATVTTKLKLQAYVIQELVQDSLGLLISGAIRRVWPALA